MRENEGGSDSEEVEKAHTPESLGMPDLLRALCKKTQKKHNTKKEKVQDEQYFAVTQNCNSHTGDVIFHS